MAKKKKKARKAAKAAVRRRPALKTKKAKKAKKAAKRPARKIAKTAKRPAKAKAPKRPAKKARKPAAPRARKEVFGEGNYTASREFRKDEEGFVRANKDRIPVLAKEAERALEGSEGVELRAAEAEGRSHAHE